MNVFEDTELTWAGVKYTIPANKMMGALARLEEVITLGELRDFAQRRAAPVVKMSMAYGAVLRYAGATVTDEEIYAKMAVGDEANLMLDSTRKILMLMIPPSVRKNVEDGKSPGTPVGNRKARRSALSKKHTS